MDAELAEFASRDFADTPKLLDVERFDEIEGFVGVDDAETIGLAIVGSDFGEEFVVRDASRGNEVEFGADALFDFACNVNSEVDARFVFCYVEESFVKRDWFDKVGVGVEDFVDLGRDLFVDLHATRHEDEVGAELFGFDRRHSRTDTEAARFVASSRHNTTHIAVAYGDGFALKFGVVALLHRGIEGIHVDMYDFAMHLFCKGNKNSYYF